jgi:hypothetical protein
MRVPAQSFRPINALTGIFNHDGALRDAHPGKDLFAVHPAAPHLNTATARMGRRGQTPFGEQCLSKLGWFHQILWLH